MYNRYIPETDECRWVGEAPEYQSGSGAPEHPAAPQNRTGGILSGLLGKGDLSRRLTAFLKSFRLSELDSGDVLMLLIAAILLLDGEDTDLGIALILVFLLGNGEKEEDPDT